MGIGIAFASGALKGYTKSARDRVEKEAAQKEKEAEQQKFYDEQFLELAGKKDANPEALRAVAKLSSFKDVEIGNIVNNVDTQTYFGPTNLGVLLPYNHSKKDPKQRPAANLLSFNEYVSNPARAEELRNKILQDPTGAAAQSVAKYLNDNFKLEQSYRFKTENKDQSIIISKDLYGSAFEFLDTLQVGLGIPTSENNRVILEED